jgi:20S proteasome subunit beta 4
MDNYYKKDLTLEEGEVIISKCINELKTRFSINMVDFDVFKLTKNGIEDISKKFNKAH